MVILRFLDVVVAWVGGSNRSFCGVLAYELEICEDVSSINTGEEGEI